MRTRSQTIDLNNNVAAEAFIELGDTQVAIGDVIHIKSNRVNVLNTPFIIEHIDGEYQNQRHLLTSPQTNFMRRSEIKRSQCIFFLFAFQMLVLRLEI